MKTPEDTLIVASVLVIDGYSQAYTGRKTYIIITWTPGQEPGFYLILKQKKISSYGK